MATELDRILPVKDQALVLAAIKAAESLTAAQIRVHLEAHGRGIEPYPRAVALFSHLGMTRTKQHTGVLLYVAVEDRRFAIVGDSGIHAVVGEEFWKSLSGLLASAFKQGTFGDGLRAAIVAVGEQLKEKLPPTPAAGNELEDAISTRKD